MFSRAYKTVVTVPPLVWVTVFLLVPYLLMFCYSFWSVSPAQTIVHSWNLENYQELLQKTVYWQTLLRSMWIAARVMLFSLLLGYPLAYFLVVLCGQAQRSAVSDGDHSAVGQLSGARVCVEDDSRFRRRAQYAAAVRASDAASTRFPALQPVRRGPDAHAHLYAIHDSADLCGAGAHSAQSGRSLA